MPCRDCRLLSDQCDELERANADLRAQVKELRAGWVAAENASRRDRYLLDCERAAARGLPLPPPPPELLT